MRIAVYILCTAVFYLATPVRADSNILNNSSAVKLCLTASEALRNAPPQIPILKPDKGTQVAPSTPKVTPQVIPANKLGLVAYLAHENRYPQKLIDYVSTFDEAKLLGNGGMGMVFKLRNTTTKEEQVIKIPIGKDAEALETHKKYLSEEAALQEKAHKASPRFVDQSEYDPELGIVKMNFIQGTTLYELSKSNVFNFLRPGEQAAIQRTIIQQLTTAITELHAEGLIHRDIKPANIMITGSVADPQSIKVKIIDLGLASDQKGKTNVQLDRIVGTPEYISPSMMRGDSNTSNDYYSLYATIHNLLSPGEGQTPTYSAGLEGDRKVIKPWGAWHPQDVPALAENNPQLRALMLLFRYAPPRRTSINEFPNYSDMMEQALSTDPEKHTLFWRSFRKHLDLRDPLEKGQILLGDDYLIEQGDKLVPMYTRMVDDAKSKLIPLYAPQVGLPEAHDYDPLEPSFLDLANGGKTSLSPLVVKAHSDLKAAEKPSSVAQPSYTTGSRVNTDNVPTVVGVKRDPVGETRRDKREAIRWLPYALAASVLAATSGGHGPMYISPSSSSSNLVLMGDDKDKLVEVIPDSKGGVKLVPVTEKANKKKKEALTKEEMEKWLKIAEDFLRGATK